ncbi:MAG: VRR-NUC domain-containing protein [Prevotellaceae bacterium]|jgi:hypothetical protein|nr:VRR-NUC domain-containing protein [Prevotellaceae bacterium]
MQSNKLNTVPADLKDLKDFKVPKSRRHDESRIQQAAVKWFRYQYPGMLLYAIPNGGARSGTEASIMKGEGVLAGVADLFLSVPAAEYHGLYIEMKTKKGRQSLSQEAFQKEAERFGYKYAVCRSLDEFMETINNYLLN